MIEAGSLREKVKKGELAPKDVLEWLRKQEHVNPKFEAWLRRRKSK